MGATGAQRHLDEIEAQLEQALQLVRATSRTDELTAMAWLETAAELGRRLAQIREASGEIRQEVLGGARTAVLAYLRHRVGDTVPASEIEGVSGIREWARRIRELRSLGWDIECRGAGQDAPYRLNADRLDEAYAMSDDLIAGIKATKPKERLIEYLLHVTPWPATAAQLEAVAGTPSWREHLQTLIDEGWLIRSHDQDPDVPAGSWMLARLDY